MFVVPRVTVVSMNDQKQSVYKETSGIQKASLGKNECVTMLELDPISTSFPLLLSFNFCVSTPLISPGLQDTDQQDQEPENVGNLGQAEGER